jgi:hypothetical protein
LSLQKTSSQGLIVFAVIVVRQIDEIVFLRSSSFIHGGAAFGAFCWKRFAFNATHTRNDRPSVRDTGCSGVGEFQRFGRTPGGELHITVTTTTTACTIHECLRVLGQFGYRHAFREIECLTPAFPLQQNYVGATALGPAMLIDCAVVACYRIE